MPDDGLPPELADVIARTTARDVALRPPSADALRRSLAPWSRSGHAPAPAPRASPGTRHVGEHEVVVDAPKEGAGERQYLADAMHEDLLGRLVRTPRVRVLARVCGRRVAGHVRRHAHRGELGALAVHRAGDGDAGAVARPPARGRLRAGRRGDRRDVDRVGARAVGPAAARSGGPALDLWLRARHVTQLDNSRVPEAVELLERAAQIAPDDPRIIATLAMAHVRRAFFIADTDPAVLVRAAQLARTALTAGPDVAEAHLAMGHLELNTADAVVAAAHFRVAIARAPHLSEGHEYLGRMLLEAGYLEQAFARLDEATAIAPQLSSARWEIARAWALEGKWDLYDKILPEVGGTRQRLVSGARYAWWRGDRASVAALREFVAEARSSRPR